MEGLALLSLLERFGFEVFITVAVLYCIGEIHYLKRSKRGLVEKFESCFKELDEKVDKNQQESAQAHQEIKQEVFEVKETQGRIETNIEWIKKTMEKNGNHD